MHYVINIQQLTLINKINYIPVTTKLSTSEVSSTSVAGLYPPNFQIINSCWNGRQILQ